jgi:UDPglucose--hexose-1-phosphate uridylyltransferase
LSELRYDPLQRRWVIIASERQHRPDDFIHPQKISSNSDNCPFCYGNEHMTPPEICAVRRDNSNPDTPGWQVRVTHNKFPALSLGDIEHDLQPYGVYGRSEGLGTHEVIIEGADHNLAMADFSEELTFDILTMYRKRLSELRNDKRLKYILIFKNHGSTAGASLLHPHSQIIATPIIPRTVQIELLSTRSFYGERHSCMICEMIKQEKTEKIRTVYDDGTIIAFNTYASRFPFELFIAPVKHNVYFHREDDSTLRRLAACLSDVLKRLKKALDDPPFNYILHTSPNKEAGTAYPGFWNTLDDDYHWHIEIIPRLVKTAGFEWGSGLHINPLPPEKAADFLRETEI